MCAWVYVPVIKVFEHPLPPHAHLHSGQALAQGAEEVRGELIDENLELEER